MVSEESQSRAFKRRALGHRSALVRTTRHVIHVRPCVTGSVPSPSGPNLQEAELSFPKKDWGLLALVEQIHSEGHTWGCRTGLGMHLSETRCPKGPRSLSPHQEFLLSAPGMPSLLTRNSLYPHQECSPCSSCHPGSWWHKMSLVLALSLIFIGPNPHHKRGLIKLTPGTHEK